MGFLSNLNKTNVRQVSSLKASVTLFNSWFSCDVIIFQVSSDARPSNNLTFETFKLDSVPYVVIEHDWISKFVRCVKLKWQAKRWVSTTKLNDKCFCYFMAAMLVPTWMGTNTKLYKFGWITFPNNARMNHRTYLNISEVVYIPIITSFLNLFIERLRFLFLMAWHRKRATRSKDY